MHHVLRVGCLALALVVTAGSIEPVRGADGTSVSLNERVVTSPNGGASVRLWNDQAGHAWYSWRREGAPGEGGFVRRWADAAPQRNELMLRYRAFDPVAGDVWMPESMRLPATGDGAYIVQVHGQVLPEFMEDLAAAGATSLTFMPWNAYLVEMSEATRDVISKRAYVRAMVPHHAAFKLDESILLNRFGVDVVNPGKTIKPVTPRAERASYNIVVLQRGLAQRGPLAKVIEAMGGVVERNFDDPGFLMRATLDTEMILALARRSEVAFIDPASEPEEDMTEQRTMGGANTLETATGYSGEGVRGEVMDGGCRTTHVGFTGRIGVHGAAVSSASHGTNCFGIVFGSGASSTTGRGMLPDGFGYFSTYNQFSTTSRYTLTAQLLQTPFNCVFQSNSWGDALTTAYTSISAQMDDIIYNNDILICQSQSNNGTQNSRPQAWAKNIVSVGGVATKDTVSITDDAWTSASIGPAADGRLKPDLSNSYDLVSTATSTSDTAYTSGFNGTSSATPIVAGHFGLYFQMWSEGVFGNTTSPAGTVFSNRPRATTSKAMMINTARQYTFSGTTANLSRYKQGWGFPQVDTLYSMRQRMFIVSETEPLSVGQTYTKTLNVVADGTPLKVTMVYRDPPGVVGASVARVNDLSLKVTAPDGVTTYWGNNGLAAGNFSTSGGVANTVDTVENVILQSPAAGTWTVQVVATTVAADTVANVAGVNANFSLVVSGIAPPASRCQPADIAFDNAAPLSLPSDPEWTNSGVNEGDYNCFFIGFFDASPDCDIANDDGSPRPPFGAAGTNGGVNEGDYNCFFQLFFSGCP